MPNQDMLAKVKNANGFIAALDQSGGSTPGALKGYGYKGDEWSSDEEMFGLIHEMRVRIISSPSFTGDKILGAILFERTMDGEANGQPVPDYLWSKGVVPFLKIDKGLNDEQDGAQTMKPMPGLDELLDQLVPEPGVGLPRRLALEVGAHRGAERVHGLEVAHLAGEGVVERGELLPLHLVERDAELPGLAALRLVGMVVGEADLGLAGLAGAELHHRLLERRDGPALAQHEDVGLRLRVRLVERGHVDPHHLARRRLLPLDREPRRLLLPHPVHLLLHHLVGDDGGGPGEREAAGAAERDGRLHLHQHLELERRAGLELEVPDARVGDRLDGLALARRLPALPDQLLEHRLADGVVVALAHHGHRGLAGAEAGEADPGLVVPDRLRLGGLDPVEGHGHLQGPAPRVGRGGLDGDVGHRLGI